MGALDDASNSNSLAGQQRPHALVLPAPLQGHIDPLLHFSLQLALQGGFIITFVNTQKSHKRMLEAHSHQADQSPAALTARLGLDIRFVCIPDGTEQALPGQGGEDAAQIIAATRQLVEGMEAQQGLLEAMVVESRASPHPITCFIADAFPWAHGLARRLGLERVIFWTSNATRLAVVAEMRAGRLDMAGCSAPAGAANVAEAGPNEVQTVGLPLSLAEVRSSMHLTNDPNRCQSLVVRLNGCEEAACIAVNTFQDLEAPSLLVASGLPTPVRSVGPLLPPGDLLHVPGTSFYQTDTDTCMPWLDSQALGSVLYVSFGSLVSLSPRQLREFALGIEDSKVPFLWAARDSARLLPEGFLDRTRGRGHVVAWAPQREVLRHAAIGGFLTHCGWNSTLESIHAGVPMLCSPIFSDQHLNELIITNIWELGLSIQATQVQDGGQKETTIGRGDVTKAIIELMSSEKLHMIAAIWKAKASRSLEEGGSSFLAIEAIINDLKMMTK